MEQGRLAFTAVYLKSNHGYIGFIEELPGVNSHGRTLEEARETLQKLAAVVFDEERREAEDQVATAERAVFGARQAFDDAVVAQRTANGSEATVNTARTNLKDAKKKLADERANVASVSAKSASRERQRRPVSERSTPRKAAPPGDTLAAAETIPLA